MDCLMDCNGKNFKARSHNILNDAVNKFQLCFSMVSAGIAVFVTDSSL